MKKANLQVIKLRKANKILTHQLRELRGDNDQMKNTQGVFRTELSLSNPIYTSIMEAPILCKSHKNDIQRLEVYNHIPPSKITTQKLQREVLLPVSASKWAVCDPETQILESLGKLLSEYRVEETDKQIHHSTVHTTNESKQKRIKRTRSKVLENIPASRRNVITRNVLSNRRRKKR